MTQKQHRIAEESRQALAAQASQATQTVATATSYQAPAADSQASTNTTSTPAPAAATPAPAAQTSSYTYTAGGGFPAVDPKFPCSLKRWILRTMYLLRIQPYGTSRYTNRSQHDG